VGPLSPWATHHPEVLCTQHGLLVAAGSPLGGHCLLDWVACSSCFEEMGREIPGMAIELSPVG
jgi:hypothetical protein